MSTVLNGRAGVGGGAPQLGTSTRGAVARARAEWPRVEWPFARSGVAAALGYTLGQTGRLVQNGSVAGRFTFLCQLAQGTPCTRVSYGACRMCVVGQPGPVYGGSLVGEWPDGGSPGAGKGSSVSSVRAVPVGIEGPCIARACADGAGGGGSRGCRDELRWGWGTGGYTFVAAQSAMSVGTEVASRTPATEPPHVPSFVLSYASRTAC